MIDAEERLGALRRQPLDRVDVLLAFVVAPPRIALRILVRQDGSARLQHGGGHIVLRGDQPDLLELPPGFSLYELGYVRIGAGHVRDWRLMQGWLPPWQGFRQKAWLAPGAATLPRFQGAR